MSTILKRMLNRMYFNTDENQGGGGDATSQAATQPASQAPALPAAAKVGPGAATREFGKSFLASLDQSDEINREVDKLEAGGSQQQDQEQKPAEGEAPPAEGTPPQSPPATGLAALDVDKLAADLGVEKPQAPAAAEGDSTGDPVLDALIATGKHAAIKAYIDQKAASPVQPQPHVQQPEAQQQPEADPQKVREEQTANRAWQTFRNRVVSNPSRYGDPSVLRQITPDEYAKAAAQGDIDKILPPPPKDADANTLMYHKMEKERLIDRIEAERREAIREAGQFVNAQRMREQMEARRKSQEEAKSAETVAAERERGVLDGLKEIARSQGISFVDQSGNLRPEVIEFAEKVIKNNAANVATAADAATMKQVFIRGAIAQLAADARAGNANNANLNLDNGSVILDKGNQTSEAGMPKTITPTGSAPQVAPNAASGALKPWNNRKGLKQQLLAKAKAGGYI